MIPNTTTSNKVVSTFDGEVVQMGFDPNALQHLMGVLSRQYADPAMAVVREYTTNAIDSHIAAGNTDPVRITRPTPFDPYLVVQDFGVGMDVNDIRSTYSQYGASTKRESNDFNGTLGIGSKSAFAYTNQFIVIGVKNGISTHVIVSVSPAGGGEMTIVSETPTNEPNGVTIKVPVKNSSVISNLVVQFASALPAGLLLVDGEDLSTRDRWKSIAGPLHDKGGKTVVNKIYLVPSNVIDGDRVFMGNVAYPVYNLVNSHERLDGMSIVADVPIGVVQFAPSRESLMDMPLTKKVLEFIGNSYRQAIVDSAIDIINKCKTRNEALTTYLRYENFFQHAKIRPTFNGVEFPRNRTSPANAMRWNMKETRGAVRTASNIPYVGEYKNTLFISGYKKYTDTLTSTAKAKIRKYITDILGRTHAINYWSSLADDAVIDVFLVDDIPNDSWLEGINWIPWEDIAAIKLNAATAAGTGTGYSFGGKHYVMTADDLKNNAPIRVSHMTPRYIPQNAKELYYVVYATERQRGDYGDETLIRRVRAYLELVPDAVFVLTYAGRVSKLKKDFPHIKGIRGSEITDKYFDALVKRVTDAEVKEYADFHGAKEFTDLNKVFKNVDTGRINDPDLADGLLKARSASISKGNTISTLDTEARIPDSLQKRIDKAKEAYVTKRARIAKDYPMVETMTRLLAKVYYQSDRVLTGADKDAMIEYVNSLYTP